MGRWVFIYWTDAEVDVGWQDRSHIAAWSAPSVKSCGLVVHEPTPAEPYWTLAGDHSQRGEDDQTNRQIVIPSGMVRRVVELQ